MIEIIALPTRTIAVDIVGELSAEYASTQTKHPIQSGSATDHRIYEPERLSLEVTQVEHPIDAPGWEDSEVPLDVRPVQTFVTSPFLAAGGAIRSIVSNVFGGGGQTFIAKTNLSYEHRGNILHQQLAEWYYNDELAAITYKGRTYPSMALLSFKRVDKQPAGGTVFQLELEARVTVDLAASVPLPSPATLQAKPPAKQGDKPGKVVPPQEIKSGLAAIADRAAQGVQ